MHLQRVYDDAALNHLFYVRIASLLSLMGAQVQRPCCDGTLKERRILHCTIPPNGRFAPLLRQL